MSCVVRRGSYCFIIFLSQMIIIFCLQDSNPLPNKYGESPKYC